MRLGEREGMVVDVTGATPPPPPSTEVDGLTLSTLGLGSYLEPTAKSVPDE